MKQIPEQENVMRYVVFRVVMPCGLGGGYKCFI